MSQRPCADTLVQTLVRTDLVPGERQAAKSHASNSQNTFGVHSEYNRSTIGVHSDYGKTKHFGTFASFKGETAYITL